MAIAENRFTLLHQRLSCIACTLRQWRRKNGVPERCSKTGECISDDRLTGAEHPERLKPETLARVQAAIAETNMSPTCRRRRSAGRLATPSTIGVLALDTVTTPFSVEITLSIEETARAHGWNSFVVNMFSDDRPEAVVDLLLPTVRTALSLPPWACARYRCRRNC